MSDIDDDDFGFELISDDPLQEGTDDANLVQCLEDFGWFGEDFAAQKGGGKSKRTSTSNAYDQFAEFDQCNDDSDDDIGNNGGGAVAVDEAPLFEASFQNYGNSTKKSDEEEERASFTSSLFQSYTQTSSSAAAIVDGDHKETGKRTAGDDLDGGEIFTRELRDIVHMQNESANFRKLCSVLADCWPFGVAEFRRCVQLAAKLKDEFGQVDRSVTRMLYFLDRRVAPLVLRFEKDRHARRCIEAAHQQQAFRIGTLLDNDNNNNNNSDDDDDVRLLFDEEVWRQLLSTRSKEFVSSVVAVCGSPIAGWQLVEALNRSNRDGGSNNDYDDDAFSAAAPSNCQQFDDGVVMRPTNVVIESLVRISFMDALVSGQDGCFAQLRALRGKHAEVLQMESSRARHLQRSRDMFARLAHSCADIVLFVWERSIRGPALGAALRSFAASSLSSTSTLPMLVIVCTLPSNKLDIDIARSTEQYVQLEHSGGVRSIFSRVSCVFWPAAAATEPLSSAIAAATDGASSANASASNSQDNDDDRHTMKKQRSFESRSDADAGVAALQLYKINMLLRDLALLSVKERQRRGAVFSEVVWCRLLAEVARRFEAGERERVDVAELLARLLQPKINVARCGFQFFGSVYASAQPATRAWYLICRQSAIELSALALLAELRAKEASLEDRFVDASLHGESFRRDALRIYESLTERIAARAPCQARHATRNVGCTLLRAKHNDGEHRSAAAAAASLPDDDDEESGPLSLIPRMLRSSSSSSSSTAPLSWSGSFQSPMSSESLAAERRKFLASFAPLSSQSVRKIFEHKLKLLQRIFSSVIVSNRTSPFCWLCFVEPSAALLRPCAHCLCEPCLELARSFFAQSSSCPFCMQRFDAIDRNSSQQSTANDDRDDDMAEQGAFLSILAQTMIGRLSSLQFPKAPSSSDVASAFSRLSISNSNASSSSDSNS
jgi:Zinc finger, C3HC4 type (RING finger)